MSSPSASLSGSEQAMPLLIINMGGEMLYILEQRLQAQAIVEEKSLRVLQDVISTMLSEKFISELFKPQKMYSSTSTRQIFDRLAHSSIMRLNTSSMDKLYDLMTMGCKYQVVSCSHPLDLYQISLNHLDALRVLVRNAPDVSRLVEACVGNMDAMFNRMRMGDLHLLRYTLARFFQDRRVKVSLFLTGGLQAQDGSMIHSHAGRLPQGALMPGTVRYFSKGALQREETLQVPNAAHVLPAYPPDTDLRKAPRPCELGSNLYANDRRKKAAGAGAAAAAANQSKSSKPAASFEPDEAAKAAAKSELNHLAAMIGASARAADADKDKFSIVNLFPDTALDGASGGGEAKVDIICFDADDRAARMEALSREFGAMGVDGKQQEDEDLLDLMDKNQTNEYDD